MVYFFGNQKRKGNIFEPGTNKRPAYFHFDLLLTFSILFGRALRPRLIGLQKICFHKSKIKIKNR